MENVKRATKLTQKLRNFCRKNDLTMPKFWYGDIVVEIIYPRGEKYKVCGLQYQSDVDRPKLWHYICSLHSPNVIEGLIFNELELDLFKEQN